MFMAHGGTVRIDADARYGPLTDPVARSCRICLATGLERNRIAMAHDQMGAPKLDEVADQILAGRLAHGLTHDINGLLTSVVSIAAEAIRANKPERLRQALATNVDYGREIATLVRTFEELFVSPPAEGRSSARTDIAMSVDRALFLCRKNPAILKVDIRQDCGGLPAVPAPIGPVTRIFAELILNALDAMPEGGVLELAATRTDELVAVTVHNSCHVAANDSSR